jgi:hypothetical protein
MLQIPLFLLEPYYLFLGLISAFSLHLVCVLKGSNSKSETVCLVITIILRLSLDIIGNNSTEIHKLGLQLMLTFELIIFYYIVDRFFTMHMVSSIVVNIMYCCLLLCDISLLLYYVLPKSTDNLDFFSDDL